MKTKTKRATVYFEPKLHKALKLKALETDQPISDLIDKAMRQSLAEDAEDLQAFDERVQEPNLDFEKVVKEMKKNGFL